MHDPDPKIRTFFASLTEDKACELADQMGELGDSFMLAYTRAARPRLAHQLWLRGARVRFAPGAGMSYVRPRICSWITREQIMRWAT